MTKALITLASLSVLIGNGSNYLVYAQSDNEIATVGDTKITEKDFYNKLKEQAGEDTLRTMILEDVLKQNVSDSDKLHKEAEDEVNKQIKEIGGEEAFERMLQYQQVSSKESLIYQTYITKMFQEILDNEIDLSDDAIKKFYDKDYQPMMEADHILVDTEEEANNAIKRLENGEDFAEVAKEVSKDSTAQDGGYLGTFTEGQMVPEFAEGVKSLKDGEYSKKPVKSQFGYHVIKAIQNGEKKPFDEVKDDVINQYKLSYYDNVDFSFGVLGKLIDKTGVNIKDKEYKDVVKQLVEASENLKPQGNEDKKEADN